MKCPFCESERASESYLPSTFFNEKQFDYQKCADCKLIYIHPTPNADDLNKMYPTTYQDGVTDKILEDPYEKLIGLRFSYGRQFDLLKKNQFQGKMLDFGCGAANFLINANYHNFPSDGVEFNPKHVAILRKEIPESTFYEVSEFLSSNEQYDLIRLSNVLEHFTEPREMMLQLKAKLKPNGYFLIEGPIETNFSIALLYRKAYFTLRKIFNKQYIANHNPTHIIFSNRKNQLQFFEDLGLKKVHWELSEAEWPFPFDWKSAKGPVAKLNFIIAKISIAAKKINKNWGNTFLYLGTPSAE